MTELAVAGALADAEGCARLLASFGFKSKFLPYLVIRKLQSISLAIGPLRLVGWGAQKVAGKLAGAEGPFTQTATGLSACPSFLRICLCFACVFRLRWRLLWKFEKQGPGECSC